MRTIEDLESVIKSHIAAEDVRFSAFEVSIDEIKKKLGPSVKDTEDAILKIKHAEIAASDVIAKQTADARAVVVQAASDAMSRVTTAAAVQSKDIEYIREAVRSLNEKFDAIDGKFTPISLHNLLEKKVDGLELTYTSKEDFVFWRNLLVGAFSFLLAALVTFFFTFIKHP